MRLIKLEISPLALRTNPALDALPVEISPRDLGMYKRIVGSNEDYRLEYSEDQAILSIRMLEEPYRFRTAKVDKLGLPVATSRQAELCDMVAEETGTDPRLWTTYDGKSKPFGTSDVRGTQWAFGIGAVPRGPHHLDRISTNEVQVLRDEFDEKEVARQASHHSKLTTLRIKSRDLRSPNGSDV